MLFAAPERWSVPVLSNIRFLRVGPTGRTLCWLVEACFSCQPKQLPLVLLLAHTVLLYDLHPPIGALASWGHTRAMRAQPAAAADGRLEAVAARAAAAAAAAAGPGGSALPAPQAPGNSSCPGTGSMAAHELHEFHTHSSNCTSSTLPPLEWLAPLELGGRRAQATQQASLCLRPCGRCGKQSAGVCLLFCLGRSGGCNSFNPACGLSYCLVVPQSPSS